MCSEGFWMRFEVLYFVTRHSLECLTYSVLDIRVLFERNYTCRLALNEIIVN